MAHLSRGEQRGEHGSEFRLFGAFGELETLESVWVFLVKVVCGDVASDELLISKDFVAKRNVVSYTSDNVQCVQKLVKQTSKSYKSPEI